MTRRAPRPLLAVLPILAVVALGGCSGGDDGGGDADPSGGSSSSSSSSSSGSADLSDAALTVQDWLAASVDGDVGACDLETPAFTRVANEASFANLGKEGEKQLTCEQRVKRSASALQDIGGDDYADTIAGATLETVEESDAAATVEVTYTEDGAPTTFTLVNDGGDWLIDSDDAIAPPAG